MPHTHGWPRLTGRPKRHVVFSDDCRTATKTGFHSGPTYVFTAGGVAVAVEQRQGGG